jgi:sugar/nucleoside kinase (ribokinase family)
VRAIDDAEKFINANWDKPGIAWLTDGTLPPAVAMPQGTGKSCSVLEGMTVYVQGVFSLDRSVFIDDTLPDFLTAVRRHPGNLRLRWAFNGSEVGGFPAQAIRTARAKGARVTVGAIVPARLPREFDRFFAEQRVDSRYLRRVGQGPVPQRLKLHFADGSHLLIVDSGSSTHDVPLPEAHFDVLLIHPGGRDTRSPLLKQLHTYAETSRRKITVGLMGCGDWTGEDWELVRDTGIRVYLNRQELTQAVVDPACRISDQTAEESLTFLRRTAGGSVVVTVTLGKQGSMVMNHVPFLTRVSAAQVPVRNLVGAGDSLMATATVSAACGASDGRSGLRGNMEAARHVAGQPPAGSLEELDREIAQHPEMVERQIALPD